MTITSPLAVAAARLDRLKADIKERQFEAAGVTQPPLLTESPGPLDHPEAVWQRAYGVRALRPGGDALAAENFPALPAGHPVSPERAAPAAEKGGEPVVPGGHIGAVLGKKGPRTGLRRLFRRRDH
jgi:hypothetical protein